MPGASTNIHHLDFLIVTEFEGICGGETGSTCVVKAIAFARLGTADTGPNEIVANDNYAPVRAAA